MTKLLVQKCSMCEPLLRLFKLFCSIEKHVYQLAQLVFLYMCKVKEIKNHLVHKHCADLKINGQRCFLLTIFNEFSYQFSFLNNGRFTHLEHILHTGNTLYMYIVNVAKGYQFKLVSHHTSISVLHPAITRMRLAKYTWYCCVIISSISSLKVKD